MPGHDPEDKRTNTPTYAKNDEKGVSPSRAKAKVGLEIDAGRANPDA